MPKLAKLEVKLVVTNGIYEASISVQFYRRDATYEEKITQGGQTLLCNFSAAKVVFFAPEHKKSL